MCCDWWGCPIRKLAWCFCQDWIPFHVCNLSSEPKTKQTITKYTVYHVSVYFTTNKSFDFQEVLARYQWRLLCCKWCRPLSCFMKCCISHGFKRQWVINQFHDCKIDVDLGQHLPFHHSSHHFSILSSWSQSLNSWYAQKQSPWKTCAGFGFGTCGVRLCLQSKSKNPWYLMTCPRHSHSLGAWEQVYSQEPGVNEGAGPETWRCLGNLFSWNGSSSFQN